MSKFAPVAPIHILQEFDNRSILGSYHLLLAHDVVKHPTEYNKLFGQRNRYMDIILDNSVVELKEPVDIKMVVEAAKIVNPTVVVLPDIYNDQQATIKSCLEALDSWGQSLWSANIQDFTFMMVPQGGDLHQFIYCAQFFVDDPRIGWWGVPRNLTAKIKTRAKATQLLHQLSRNKKIHLLGFSDDILDDIYSAILLCVSGIDSAVPIRMASLEMEFFPVQGGVGDLPPRGTWWDDPNTTYISQMAVNLHLARKMFMNDSEYQR